MSEEIEEVPEAEIQEGIIPSDMPEEIVPEKIVGTDEVPPSYFDNLI